MMEEQKPFIHSYLSLAALPGLNLFLVVLTILVSTSVPGGTYYRIFGVDPVAGAVGMVDEGVLFFSVLLLVGTGWWFFIGYIGWKSRKGMLSRPIAALGAMLSLFSALTRIMATKQTVLQDLRDAKMSVGALCQYACVGLLCLGALVVTIYSASAALGRRKTV
jgi:hypothetical protein